MKNKSLFFIAPLVLLAALIGVVPASADAMMVEDGDQVLFIGQMPGHSATGGSFHFRDVTQGFDFYTYCVEVSEHINPGSTYYAVVNFGSISGGQELPPDSTPGFDELDPMSAYIFSEWSKGNLSEFTQQEIQDALWFIEDSVGQPENSPGVLELLDMAEGAEGLYDVYVLNLYTTRTWVGGEDENFVGAQNGNGSWVYSGNAQDVLFTPVPEPSTILLLGVGLAGIGMIARRRAKK